MIMKRYSSSYGKVLLTEERLRHITAFHPEVARYIQYFAPTLAKPEVIRQSTSDPNTFICYRRVPKRKISLSIVVKIDRHPFVLTAYLAKPPKSDIL